MVDLVTIEHLIDSITDAITKLERAIIEKRTEEANNLRTFIFDIHTQIDKITKI